MVNVPRAHILGAWATNQNWISVCLILHMGLLISIITIYNTVMHYA